MKSSTNRYTFVDQIIERSAWNPALFMNRTDLGNLDVGSIADISVFNIRSGQFGLIDAEGKKVSATQKFECELTLRAGEIVWDLNGISAIPF